MVTQYTLIGMRIRPIRIERGETPREAGRCTVGSYQEQEATAEL